MHMFVAAEVFQFSWATNDNAAVDDYVKFEWHFN